MFIDSFTFPSRDDEEICNYGMPSLNGIQSVYPFLVLKREKRIKLEFEPLTIIYGSNGSGKSTMLKYYLNGGVIYEQK